MGHPDRMNATCTAGNGAGGRMGMSDERTTLSRFCEAHAPHHYDAAFLFGELEEFFRRGAASRYELDGAPKGGDAFVRAAVERLVGRPVDPLRCYGRGELYPARTDTRDENRTAFSRSGVTAIERDTATLLKTALWNRFVDPLQRIMGAQEYHVLSETFMRTLGEQLWHSFENEYWEAVGYELVLNIRALIFLAVHAFIGHVVWGDPDLVCGLHPFVSCLTSCIPYGLADASDGRVLVITA